MPTIVFTYSENKPINYREFTQWLFYSCPNLKKYDNYEKVALRKYCHSAIELSLGVSEDIAKKLCENAIKLGFMSKDYYNVDGVYVYECRVDKPR